MDIGNLPVSGSMIRNWQAGKKYVAMNVENNTTTLQQKQLAEEYYLAFLSLLY